MTRVYVIHVKRALRERGPASRKFDKRRVAGTNPSAENGARNARVTTRLALGRENTKVIGLAGFLLVLTVGVQTSQAASGHATPIKLRSGGREEQERDTSVLSDRLSLSQAHEEAQAPQRNHPSIDKVIGLQ